MVRQALSNVWRNYMIAVLLALATQALGFGVWASQRLVALEVRVEKGETWREEHDKTLYRNLDRVKEVEDFQKWMLSEHATLKQLLDSHLSEHSRK